MGMGIDDKIGNGNGKEWESIAREWEWECKKPFPGISSPYYGMLHTSEQARLSRSSAKQI